jgi:hypothetical protein
MFGSLSSAVQQCHTQHPYYTLDRQQANQDGNTCGTGGGTKLTLFKNDVNMKTSYFSSAESTTVP